MSSSAEQTSNPFLHSRSEDVSGDDLWKRYLDVVGEKDKASIERWQGSTSGLLTFTGIFAATAVFVGNQTIHLLALLVSANNPTLAVPNPDISSSPFDFHMPTSVIIMNSLWFLSLVISLVCTLIATLVQEWSRNFQRACSDKTVKEAAFNHISQRMGVDRYGLDYMTSVTVGLIHVAVVLFLVGLVIFLAPVHQVPALVVITSSAIAAAFYVVASAIPVFSHDCPYQTWLTPVFGSLGWAMYTMIFTPILVGNWARERRPKDGRRIDSSIILALIKGVGRYTYELFDPDVDYVYLNDLPHDLKTDSLILTWLRGRATDWKHFLNGSRLAFIWERMSGYLLLDPEVDKAAIGALLDHLPRQISGGDIKSVSMFIVRLRRRDRFMKPLAHRMREVNSAATAVGALQLLQMLVTADSPDAPMYDFLGGHGKITEDTIVKHFPSIVAQIDTAHKHALCVGDLSVLIAVTKLRWTLLNKRNEVLHKAQNAGDDDEKRTPPNDEEIGRLHAMLLCLEKPQGLRLLPLPLSDCCGHEQSEPQESREDYVFATVTEHLARPCSWRVDLADGLDRFDLSKFGRDVAARNALTLLAYLVWFGVQAKGSGGSLPHSSIGNSANVGFDGPERKKCRPCLGGWRKHLKATEPIPGAHVQPASFPWASAVFAYLCDEAIGILQTIPRVDSAGRVTEFASEKKDGDEDSGGCKAIRNLLNELVNRVSYHPPRSPSTSTSLGQTTSSGTKEDSEGLKMLKECGIFGTQMQHPAKTENLSSQGVGCSAGGAEEQII